MNTPPTPHTLQDQLKQLAAIHAVESALLTVKQDKDVQDIHSDAAWGGHHARLVMPIDGAD